MNTELLIPNIKNASICVHNVENADCDYLWDWHIHDEYELYMSLGGVKTFYVNDYAYTLSKGDIILINEKVPHKTETQKGSQGFLIQIKPAFESEDIYRYLLQFITQTENSVFLFKADTEINLQLSCCLANIIAENETKAQFFEEFIKSDVYRIFAILYRYDIIKNPEQYFNTKEVKKLLPALQYINKNYKERISLESMSSMLNVDRAHFCRIFKKAVNTPMVDYLNFVRISKAEKLLLTTKMSIGEIAEQTGFFSTAYFCKLFKRYKDCSPSQYRKCKSI